MLRKLPELGISMLALLALSILLASFYLLDQSTIAWQVVSTLHKDYSNTYQQVVDNQTLVLPQAVYWVTENFAPSYIQTDGLVHYLALGCFVLVSSLVLAAGTGLKKIWFYVVVTIGLLGLATVGIDSVMAANSLLWGGAYVLSNLVIVGVFFIFFTNKSTLIRFISFLLVQTLFLVIVAQKVGSEGLELWGVKTYFALYFYAHIGLLVLGCGIPLYILKIASSAKSKYGLVNFVVGMGLYLTSMFLLDGQHAAAGKLHAQYLNLVIVLCLAVVALIAYLLLELPKYVANQWPIVCLILAGVLASILLLSIGFNSLNDSLLLEITSATSTIFLWAGLGFMAYVLVNFLPLFLQNLQVAQVLFKPRLIPFGYFLFATVFVIVAIWLGNGFYNWNQLKAANSVALADHAEKYQNYTLAEAYYKKALKEDYTSYRASISLGSMAKKLGDNPAAGSYYRQAAKRKFNPMAYAAWAQSLLEEDLYFDALFAYREGIRTFPDNAELLNNMALVFHKAKAADSSLVYLQKAIALGGKAEVVAKTNALAMELFYPNRTNAKSISTELTDDYNSLISNTLAKSILKNELNNAVYVPIKNPVDTSKPLSMADFAFLVNASTYQGIKTQKTGALLNLAKLQALDPAMKVDLQEAYVQNEFLYGNKLSALDTLQNMSFADSAKTSFFTSWQKTALKIAPEMPVNHSDNYLQNIAQNPLNEGIVNKNIALANKQRQVKEVHSLLLQGIRVFPENASLLKAYISQCFLMNVPQDAAEAMLKLETLDPNVALTFSETYQKQKDAYYKKLAF
jgi:tetratricopeptide (TPR) repeat protein